MQTPSFIAELIYRFLDETITSEEQALLEAWRQSDPQFEQAFQQMTAPGYIKERLPAYYETTDEARKQLIYERIIKTVNSPSKLKSLPLWKRSWVRYAAMVLLLAGTAFFLYTTQKEADSKVVVSQTAPVKDIPPGKEGAILTLADGSTMSLEAQNSGLLAVQGNTKLIIQDGKLLYNADNSGVSTVVYNTMTTPRGRQYHLVLPDGSRVWLNAASSITYPVVFTGKERRVKISGEAYLEVVKSNSSGPMPFIVESGSQEVEVLGTRFNINSYQDEKNIKTTLLEGLVQVSVIEAGAYSAGKKPASWKLSPGQQLSLSVYPYSVSRQTDANISQVMAWKNGLFNFQDMSFEEIMRQLARWYNIDVKYEGRIPDQAFEGKLGRDVSLLKLLTFFSEWGVHYRLENDNTLIIINK